MESAPQTIRLSARPSSQAGVGRQGAATSSLPSRPSEGRPRLAGVGQVASQDAVPGLGQVGRRRQVAGLAIGEETARGTVP